MTKASGTPRNTAGTPHTVNQAIEKKQGTPRTPKKGCVAALAPTKPSKPPPSAGHLKAIEEGMVRLAAKRVTPTLVWQKDAENQTSPAALHSDHNEMVTHMLDTMGTGSLDFLGASLDSLECMTRERAVRRFEGNAQPVNAGLALIDAIRSQNELEGALATQMVGTHALVCELLGRAKGTDRADHIQLYGGLAVKLQRAFTGQIDALTRLRRGGEQVVRHIHVDNRGGRAVVADTVNIGAKENEKGGGQSHGPYTSTPCGPPMLGQDPTGNGLPIASDTKSKAVPYPRGS